jgi:hypothetical protein
MVELTNSGDPRHNGSSHSVHSGKNQTCPGCDRKPQQCTVCDRTVMAYDNEFPLCRPCYMRYPDPLIKANSDPFDYVARLTTGELIRFNESDIRGNWVHLWGSEYDGRDRCFSDLPYPCPRGISVRIAQISWVADAPRGS